MKIRETGTCPSSVLDQKGHYARKFCIRHKALWNVAIRNPGSFSKIHKFPVNLVLNEVAKVGDASA
jgi:hypothetical protein